MWQLTTKIQGKRARSQNKDQRYERLTTQWPKKLKALTIMGTLKVKYGNQWTIDI